jgi:hypothetical protein
MFLEQCGVMEISTSLCEYADCANCGSGVFCAHTHTHTHGRTPLHEWSAHRIGRYLHITQQTQQTNINVLNAFRTRDPSNRAAADLRLIPNGHRDRWRSLTPSTFERFLGCLAQRFSNFLQVGTTFISQNGLTFNLRGPQGQNPRTTCGPRTTVWEMLLHMFRTSSVHFQEALH